MAATPIPSGIRKNIPRLRRLLAHTFYAVPLGRQWGSNQTQPPYSGGQRHAHYTTQTSDLAGSGRKLNVGILGLGRIGQLHLGNVLENRRFRLAWLLDSNPKLLEETRDAFRLAETPLYSSDDYDSLLEDDRLNGVLVLTATPTHTDLSVRALRKGKAVFTEKPAGETIGDVTRCYDTAEEYQKPFLVGFNRRFDPTFVSLHDTVHKGMLGRLQYLRLTARDSPKPSYDFLRTCDTTGCNILADMSVHCVDQLVWITEAERPEHIYVTTHAHDETMAEFGEADAIGVLVKYKSGVIASLDTFRESPYGYDIRLEAFGSKGMVLADNPRDSSTLLDSSHGGSLPRLYNSFPQRFEASFKGELDHFADCIEGVSTPRITRQECLMVSEIIDKGLESYRTKMPVYF